MLLLGERSVQFLTLPMSIACVCVHICSFVLSLELLRLFMRRKVNVLNCRMNLTVVVVDRHFPRSVCQTKSYTVAVHQWHYKCVKSSLQPRNQTHTNRTPIIVEGCHKNAELLQCRRSKYCVRYVIKYSTFSSLHFAVMQLFFCISIVYVFIIFSILVLYILT